jgi:AraC-like DNA-binding protein
MWQTALDIRLRAAGFLDISCQSGVPAAVTTRVPPLLPADEAAIAGFDAKPTRVGANCLLIELLREQGHDPAPLFAAAGIDMAHFANPDAIVPMRKLAMLLQHVITGTGRRDIGLMVADRARHHYIGLLAHRLAAEPDLRAALGVLVRLVPLNTRSAAMRLVSDDSEARLEIASQQPFSDVAATYDDAIVAISYFNLRNLLGGHWTLVGVDLAHQATAAPSVYRRLYGVRPRFNQPVSALIFPRADLARRLPGGGPPLDTELAARAAAARLDLDVEDKTRAMIRAHIAHPGLSRAMVARLLGVSSRTLNRRLVDNGVTFAALLRDTRHATATHLLADADMAIGDVAAALGYPDQSAFSRAFRLWSGTTPRQWRAAYGKHGAEG